MGGLVGSAPVCYGSSLGSNPDISQKYKMDDITHCNPPKKYTKNFKSTKLFSAFNEMKTVFALKEQFKSIIFDV
jgi:hypothetical protein